MGSLWKRHYCWPSPVPCGSRQVPLHQLGWKIGQGLGRDESHCCSIQWVWITLGKCTQVGNATEVTSCIKEVPCGDYTYGLAKGSTTYGSLWDRLSQPGVRSIHSRDCRRSLPGKDTGSPWGEPYRGRIHMWDHLKGNHYTRAPSPAQWLTLGKNTSAGPGVQLYRCLLLRRPAPMPKKKQHLS